MDHFIRIYDKFLDLETCNEIIDKFEEDDRKQPGKTQSGYNPEVKMCTELHMNLSGWEELDHKIFRAVNLTYKQYCEECPSIDYAVNNFPVVDTGYQIQKYEPNDIDQFNWHIDSSGDSYSRILAAIIYLNDVKIGGETEFLLNNSESFMIKPQAGTIIWFPPFFLFPHRGKKAIDEPKYIITTFIAYKNQT